MVFKKIVSTCWSSFQMYSFQMHSKSIGSTFVTMLYIFISKLYEILNIFIFSFSKGILYTKTHVASQNKTRTRSKFERFTCLPINVIISNRRPSLQNCHISCLSLAIKQHMRFHDRRPSFTSRRHALWRNVEVSLIRQYNSRKLKHRLVYLGCATQTNTIYWKLWLFTLIGTTSSLTFIWRYKSMNFTKCRRFSCRCPRCNEIRCNSAIYSEERGGAWHWPLASSFVTTLTLRAPVHFGAHAQ